MIYELYSFITKYFQHEDENRGRKIIGTVIELKQKRSFENLKKKVQDRRQ